MITFWMAGFDGLTLTAIAELKFLLTVTQDVSLSSVEGEVIKRQ